MHELSVASELYQGLRLELEARGGTRLVRARILVGELSAIEPKLLRFAWEAVLSGTPDEGATLEIEWSAVSANCPTCGRLEATPAGSWLRLCPHCAAPVVLEGGRELDVLLLVFDEQEHAPLTDRESRDEHPRPIGATRR